MQAGRRVSAYRKKCLKQSKEVEVESEKGKVIQSDSQRPKLY